MPTLPEAVDSKYCDDSAVVTEVSCIALQLRRSGRQRLPSVLILADCEIEEAGQEEELQKRCEGVKELDISNNKIKHWDEVIKILRHTPSLCFLNLSFNHFGVPLSTPEGFQLSQLTRLVLNGTKMPWGDVETLLQNAPKVEELHVCMNDYSKLNRKNFQQFPTVTRIHFNNNPTKDWSEIEVLGLTFPQLQALVLAECPIEMLPKKGRFSAAFPRLKYLSLNSTKISQWDSVYLINDFPGLSELRLNNCPLYEYYNDSDRRALTIAAVWRIKRLNGGDMISDKEREDAERRFIRYYMSKEPKPDRYYELIALHGELSPLLDISLKPAKEVEIKVIYGDLHFTHTFNVYLKVQEVKKILQPKLNWPASRMRLFFKKDYGLDFQDQAPTYCAEEIKINTKQLYTFNVDSGDHFIVVEK